MTYLYICIIIFKLLGILLVLAQFYNPNRVWRIKKGNHYVSLWQRAKFFNWWVMTWKLNTKTMSYTALFTESCSYILPKNQMDWNKLPGLQYGFTNKNSIRPGWRWATDILPAGALFTTSYRHENGNTDYDEFSRVGISAKLPADFIADFNDNVMFIRTTANDNGYNGYPHAKVRKSFPVLPLFVYFGGTCKAPHDMSINISNLTINGRKV